MVTPPNDAPDFDAWLAGLYEPNGVPDDEVNSPALRWLRRGAIQANLYADCSEK